MGLALGPAIAAQTNPPVPIHGRAPTATGKLILQMQEVPGVTLSIVDNTLVSGAKKPNEFTFTPVPGSIFTDADGDARGTSGTLGLSVAPSGAVWTWKGPGGTPLTATQLNQTFATNFAHNTVLTVQATAPVIATSLTGIPTTSGIPTDFASPTYRVIVNIPPPPVIHVNGHTFAWNSGFPTTGFVGAKFQLYMNGVDAAANSNYTYTETGNKAWTKVDSSGTITFIGTATTANKSLNIVATNKSDSNDKHTLGITLGRWFVNNGSTLLQAANADAYCTGLGGGYSTQPIATMTNAAIGKSGTRAPVAGLWSQWGPMEAFGQGWRNQRYWSNQPNGTGRYDASLGTGRVVSLSLGPQVGTHVACSRVL
ncbi:hypothetical protein CRN84_20400 [Budvicia aquatica]|uniref:Invasin domain-containing protein n=2 Tax=Budvicia aquatica TaxID=82979 RepID=A0A2C6DMG9_9GAMM|nr:hypothetical protein CRN84_20400 [Budvicia aquatica]